MRSNRNESHFLIAIASFLLITIQVENRKAQFRSSAVDIGKLSLASEMEPFFPERPTVGLDCRKAGKDLSMQTSIRPFI